jgi:hypothetical protein
MTGLEFLIPMLISAGIQGIAGGISSWQRSRANRQQAQAAQEHSGSLEEMINRMFSTDTTRAPVDAAARQIGGSFAGAGLAGSGMSQAAAAEAAASIVAQDMQRKQALEAQIRQDPSFRTPDPEGFNPGLDAILGFLGGAGAGGAEAFGQYIGTETGANWLAGLGSAPAVNAATYNPGVTPAYPQVVPSGVNLRDFGVGYKPNFMDRRAYPFDLRVK